MAESVDALVSNTSGAIRPGSTPGLGTERRLSIGFQCSAVFYFVYMVVCRFVLIVLSDAIWINPFNVDVLEVWHRRNCFYDISYYNGQVDA